MTLFSLVSYISFDITILFKLIEFTFYFVSLIIINIIYDSFKGDRYHVKRYEIAHVLIVIDLQYSKYHI